MISGWRKKNSPSVLKTLGESNFSMSHHIGVTMSVTSRSRVANSLALLDSIRRFVAEVELRADAIEIMNIESAMWNITREEDLRRHKAPPVKLPQVRKIEP